MENSIEIHKYAGYFHDGSILEIIHKNSNLEILMESAQLEQDCIEKIPIPISKNNTIKGKLHIEKIKSIKQNGKKIRTIKKMYDEGDIDDFEIKNNSFLLIASWINYDPNNRIITQFFKYEIQAGNIYWENTPNN